ncbi:MAG: sortase B protein-sorting domain-containing protein [Lachnospiraceae bacterium]|nr:sortase B protein-sorting domain-containing protein [Lachnospiraceae bacterium]
MKKHTKLLFSLILSIVLMLFAAIPAFAADSNVTYAGEADKFIFSPGTGYSPTDLFDNFKNVMPGDKVTESITITNKASDCDYVKVYLRAIAHDEEGNPLTYDEAFEAADGKDQAGVTGQRDETVVTMADFLAQLSMKVYQGEKVLFEASPDELGGLSENVFLGELRQGETTTLTVELAVPIELGNEYASRVGEVDWVFTVETFDDPEEEPEDSQPDKPSSGTVTTTGDNSQIGLYIVLVLICGVLLLVIRKHAKKQNGEKEWAEEN